MVYRIQKRRKAQPKVDHSDRLKPYLGPPLERWIFKEADAVIEPETRGERLQMCIRQFVDDGQLVPSTRDRELNLTKHNLRTRAMFPREIGMLIELGMITVFSPPNNVREPEPRAELPTSVVDDHNWDGVGRQTVKSTIDWEGFQCL